MWRKYQVQIALVLLVTAVLAVAAAIWAQNRVPVLGTAFQYRQGHGIAPIASLPFLAVGYLIVMRIIARGQREAWERSRGDRDME